MSITLHSPLILQTCVYGVVHLFCLSVNRNPIRRHPVDSFDNLLEISTKIHGHLCAGQVIGVRMSMLGLERIGIDDPKGADRKKLYVLVEIDRCATDAIQSVTGCSLGKRSMRWMDFGIMAATFVNLETGKAVRITAR
ncbi:MAG: formylmethanofuran dehydrogenase subunit E family protein, partial [Deltaproteobacteria bacterium]|nr:formylmethanofuran dehydrogenase subunit E family protein [Deltaproteobacteria bacterium]